MRHRLFYPFVLAIGLSMAASVASAQWYPIPDLEYTNVKCLLSVSDSTIFVGGDNFTLLRSTDNGITWTNVMGNGIAADTPVSAAIYDIKGRCVDNLTGRISAETSSLVWDSSLQPAGIYIVRLKAVNEISQKIVALVR